MVRDSVNLNGAESSPVVLLILRSGSLHLRYDQSWDKGKRWNKEIPKKHIFNNPCVTWANTIKMFCYYTFREFNLLNC